MQQIKADVRYFCIFLPHICSVILFPYYYNKKSVIQSLVLYQSVPVRRRGSQLIAALILRMTVMAFDPDKFHLMGLLRL